MREPPDTTAFVRALNEYFDAPEERFRSLLDAFVGSTLITLDDEDEDSTLLLFTDLVELHMFAPDARWVAMPSEEAIRAVASGDFDAIVVNPGGRSFELTHEDVADLFDID